MVRRGSLVFLAVLLLAGCAGQRPGGPWGMRWPSAGEAGEAAVAAARSPATWLPLAAAAVLQVNDWDEEVSAWAADERPVFGDRAAAWSDDLRLASNAAWLLSTLPQPDDDPADPLARRLGVGASTLLLERAATFGIKEAVDRRRPDGSDARSFPSGHAGTLPVTSWPVTLWVGSLPLLWPVLYRRLVRTMLADIRCRRISSPCRAAGLSPCGWAGYADLRGGGLIAGAGGLTLRRYGSSLAC